MIRDIISNTPLTTPEADEFFGDSITGGEVCGDVSILAVARAIVTSRMDIRDSLDLRFDKYLFGSYYVNKCKRNSLTIVNAKNCLADNPIEFIAQRFLAVNPQYEEITKARDFFNQKQVVCTWFLDKKNKNSVVFCQDLSITRLHFLAMALPAFIPWFLYQSPLSTTEVDLLYSIGDETPDAFIGLLGKFANEYGIHDTREGCQL